jgi:GntR family transcriptional repressor for pyruvate dehydrogenase complex
MSISKNFHLVIQKIHSYIQERNLKSGDRLPSERELAEQLGVGRSSVREALKALELLGLITTRRGEGTFIEDRSSHQLFELIALFIVQNQEQTQQELLEMLAVLEEQAIRLTAHRINQEDYAELKFWMQEAEKCVTEKRFPFEEERAFYRVLARATGNSIFYRTYKNLLDFKKAVFPSDPQHGEMVLGRLKLIIRQLGELVHD